MGIYQLAKKGYNAIKPKEKQPLPPEQQEAFNRGYQKQNLKIAEAEGRHFATKEQNRRATRGQGPMAGFQGTIGAIGGSISQTEKAFGFSNNMQLGGGLDFGLGMNQKPKKPMPTRVTTVTKSGTVKIVETGETPAKKRNPQSGSPYNWMSDIDKNNFFE